MALSTSAPAQNSDGMLVFTDHARSCAQCAYSSAVAIFVSEGAGCFGYSRSSSLCGSTPPHSTSQAKLVIMSV
jgi:hypothetical protein